MIKKNFRRASCIALTAAAAAMLSVSAFAAEWGTSTVDHNDRTFKFIFNTSNNQTDHTTWETKDDNTNVYIKAVAYTLPSGGFTVQSQYKNLVGLTSNASKGAYRINDYNEHSIRSDNVSGSLTGKKVRIEGGYKNMTCSYGDVTVKWSPDTYGNVPSLN